MAGKAAAVEGRPVLRVADDRAVTAGDFREVVPITPLSVERDVTVGQIEIQRAVVVQIAELSAEAPPAQLDAEVTRDVFVFRDGAHGTVLRQPQIVALNQDAVLRNVRNVNGIATAIENVAKGDVHPALRRESDAGLLAGFAESPTFVQVELGDAVVVGNEEIGTTGAAQVRGGRSKRPAAAVDPDLRAYFLELAVAQIVE